VKATFLLFEDGHVVTQILLLKTFKNIWHSTKFWNSRFEWTQSAPLPKEASEFFRFANFNPIDVLWSE